MGSTEKERFGEKAKKCPRSLGNLPARVGKNLTKQVTELYNTMGRWIAAVIAAKGQHTKSVHQWSGRPGFNSRLSHTKDSKNGTWYLLAEHSVI